MRTRHELLIAVITLAILGSPAATSTRGQSDRRPKIQPATFSDPDRRAKLSAAFGEIDRAFADFAARQHVPGAAWGVIVDGELVHSGSTGYRELAAKAPVDADTIFRIASMTKSFTAMAVLKLRDEGKLSLDDPAEKYIRRIRRPIRRGSPFAICCRTRRVFQKITRGVIASSPRPTTRWPG